MQTSKFINGLIGKMRSLKRIGLFFISILKIQDQRKFAFKWLISLKKDYLLNKPSPWITFGAIEYLEGYFKTHKEVKVFEYGSGGSTLYWLKKGASCISIEHNSEWFSIINPKIRGKSHFDYRLVLPSKNSGPERNEWDASNPLFYISSEDKDISYEEYVKQIVPYPDNYFDIILIDGRARPSCLFHSYNKVKPGGIIVLDNAERLYYLSKTSQYLTNFRRRDFYGVVPTMPVQNLTTIFQRHFNQVHSR